MKTLTIATRKSPLAMVQAETVATQLRALGQPTQLLPLLSDGDRSAHVFSPIHKDSFVKDIEQALLRDKADLAVHSLKDMPRKQRAGLTIAAYAYPAAVEDVLLCRDEYALTSLPAGCIVGTSSPRRRGQLLHARPDLTVAQIRGNVGTRLSKWDSQDYDALLLARAGLDRLKIGYSPQSILPVDSWLPAPCQGILAIQCKDDDASLKRILASLDDNLSRLRAVLEQRVGELLQADCTAPVAALARINAAGHWQLTAQVTLIDGSQIARVEKVIPYTEKIAELQEFSDGVVSELIERGAIEILQKSAAMHPEI